MEYVDICEMSWVYLSYITHNLNSLIYIRFSILNINKFLYPINRNLLAPIVLFVCQRNHFHRTIDNKKNSMKNLSSSSYGILTENWFRGDKSRIRKVRVYFWSKGLMYPFRSSHWTCEYMERWSLDQSGEIDVGGHPTHPNIDIEM